MKKLIVVLATCLLVGNASAFLPDRGWYFNAAESGRGFNIEIQNNLLFMAGFFYDGTGKPIWVVSGGPMSTDHTYSGAAFQTANGQPLGGNYRAATSVPFGTATVTFPSTVTANVSINGFSFAVARQIFGFDFASTVQPLLGEFAFVDGSAGSYFAERVTFSSTQISTSDGTPFAVGNATGDSSRVAVGRFDASRQKWTLLLDLSTSYYDFKTFVFEGVNLIEGDDYTYLKTSSPAGGLPMIGHRIRSAQAAAGANAPGVTKSISQSDVLATDSYTAARASTQVARTLEPSHLETIRALEAMLESARADRAR